MQLLLVRLFLVSLTCSLASAQAPASVQSDLERLKQARAQLMQPGAHALVYEAVDRVVAGGSVHSIRPLCSLLLETYAQHEQLREARRKAEEGGATLRERRAVLAEELVFLRKKARAGDKSAGRKIELREHEERKATIQFDELFARVRRIERLQVFIVELRGRVLRGLSTLCRVQPESLRDTGMQIVRQSLDMAREDQALQLVLILRDSELAESVAHFRVIAEHPKATIPVLRQVVFALSRHNTLAANKAILAIAELRPELEKTVLHVLSMAAKKKLATTDQAKAHFK